MASRGAARRAPRPCERDLGVMVLGWALIAGMGCPLMFGVMSLAAPERFASWFGEVRRPQEATRPVARPPVRPASAAR